jgi:hypothetical protein
MLDCAYVKKGSTQRLVALFMDAAGGLKTALNVGVRVIRKSDGHYLRDDGTWAAVPNGEPAATEWDAIYDPGVYFFDWTVPDAIDEYLVRFDGGNAAANRYQFVYLRAVKIDAADLHKAKAALVNKQVQTIHTGVVTIKDDDGATALMTLTPSVDDTDNPMQNILTPG